MNSAHCRIHGRTSASRRRTGKRTVPGSARAALAAAAALLLGGCGAPGVLGPAGRIGAEEKSLILTAAVLMLVVVVPVIIMTIVFTIRYRASNRRADYRPEWSHSRALEIAVWAVPIAIVAALGYLGWTRSHALDPFKPIPSRFPAVTIQVISLDWKWLFIYPDENVASVNELAFPVGTPVDFHITADTVMNSFFIPRLGSQIYSMAGMETRLHLLADRAGAYEGLSANFSGDGFSRMTFTALALPAQGYRDWLARARASGRTLDRAGYKELERPSENNPVAYYGRVEPNLFREVIDKYRGGMMAAGS